MIFPGTPCCDTICYTFGLKKPYELISLATISGIRKRLYCWNGIKRAIVLGLVAGHCVVTSIVQAATTTLEDASDSASKPDAKASFDWSKPAVSRGFGYEAKTDAEKAFEVDFKQAQIAYFFQEYHKALAIWRRLADKGHVESMASLAWLYHAGLGTPKDLARAYELYTKAAEKGQAVAQNNLGVFYKEGLYVTKDLVKAREWFRRSAENGYRFGQFNYAELLAAGEGGEQDLAAARLWYNKAASQGVSQARAKLAALQ